MPHAVTATFCLAIAAVVPVVACGPTLVDMEAGSTDSSDIPPEAETAEPPSMPDPEVPTASGGTAPDPLPPSTTADSTDSTDSDTAGSGSTGSSGEPAETYPTFRALFDDYLETGCTPFKNVCHSNKEQPDLSSVEAYLAAFGSPCNAPRLENDPLGVYDRCEPPGDSIIFQDGNNFGWTTDVAWVEVVDNGANVLITLRDPIPASDGATESALAGTELGDIHVVGLVLENSLSVPSESLTQTELVELSENVVGGDPNRDGQFGGDDPMYQLAVGSADDSYLYAAMAGTVPGSHLPLDLGPEELRALGCWIEQVVRPGPRSVDTPINYSTCTLGD